jgi:hypothetical protein
MEVTRGHQGQGPQQDVEHFGRVIDAPAIIRCLDCHATRGEILDHALHGLEPNVGCQKCHWPGREHVMAMRKAKAEGRVFPNAKEPAALEQIRACSRCHLQPGAGDELEAMPNHIRSVRVQAPELLQSRCFSQSKNRLSCSTCHDPHAPISRDPAHYVQRCLTCHGVPNSVACPVSPRKDCVRCHTPVVPAENGSPWHDHRIRKPAGGRSEVAPKERTLNPEP